MIGLSSCPNVIEERFCAIGLKRLRAQPSTNQHLMMRGMQTVSDDVAGQQDGEDTAATVDAMVAINIRMLGIGIALTMRNSVIQLTVSSMWLEDERARGSPTGSGQTGSPRRADPAIRRTMPEHQLH
jgi:hypothetical protein